MKIIRILSLTILATFLTEQSSSASILEREGRFMQMERATQAEASEPDMVYWIGRIKDDEFSHNSNHEHELQFVKENGDTFDIVDSPELVKLHHETEKNYLLAIEAERTPRFLFWGGNLIVKTFKVIEESGAVPHLSPEESTTSASKPVRTLERHGI